MVILVAALVLPHGAGAQHDPPPDAVAAPAQDTIPAVPAYRLAEIVVLETRNAVTRAATVHEVGRERIEELDIRSPVEAMEHVPGVYFSQSSRSGHTFRLRGFDQRQVSVFVDGVPVSLPYDGLVDISQFVGSDLESVRVSHGFSSLLHGANSLGGVVNLRTRPPAATPSLHARLEGSDHGRSFASAEVAGGTGRLRFSGSAAWERASSFHLSDRFLPTANEEGGARANSSYERKRFTGRGHYLINESHGVSLAASAIDNRFDVPPNALSSHPRFWRFPVWRKGVISLSTDHDLTSWLGLRTVWFHDRHRNMLRSFDDATFTTQERRYAFDSEYDDHSSGFNLYPSFSVLSVGATDAVVSYRRDVHRGRDWDDPFDRQATDLVTVGLEQDLDWSDAVSFMVGGNVSELRPTGDGDDALPVRQLNAQAAVRHQHGEALASRVAVARKSRFPTMKELYSARHGRNLPNPDLRAETAIHTEVGLDMATGAWQGSAALFRSQLTDAITDVVIEPGLRQLQNLSRARMEGIELDARRSVQNGTIGVAYTLLRALNRSPDRESDRLEYRPAHRLSAMGSLRLGERSRIGGDMSYTASQHYQNLDTGAWEPLNDMLMINLRAEHRLLDRLSVYARVGNLLDGAYFSRFGLPSPGRELSIGLKAR